MYERRCTYVSKQYVSAHSRTSQSTPLYIRKDLLCVAGLRVTSTTAAFPPHGIHFRVSRHLDTTRHKVQDRYRNLCVMHRFHACIYIYISSRVVQTDHFDTEIIYFDTDHLRTERCWKSMMTTVYHARVPLRKCVEIDCLSLTGWYSYYNRSGCERLPF